MELVVGFERGTYTFTVRSGSDYLEEFEVTGRKAAKSVLGELIDVISRPDEADEDDLWPEEED